MNKKMFDKIHRINYLTAKMDERLADTMNFDCYDS